MKEDFFKEIGLKLNQTRLKKGYSLEQISSSTKISIQHLKNIEDGNFRMLPGKFYEKSFIKIYARVLRIKDTKLINIYNKAYDVTSDEINIKERELNTNNLGIFNTKIPRLSFIFLLFFVFIFIIFFQTFLKKENTILANIENKANISIPKLDEIYKENQSNSAVDEIIDLKKDTTFQNTNLNTENTELNDKNKNFYLKQIVAIEDVWIEIQDEYKNVIIATLLKKNETFKLPNEEKLLISTSNAGALEIKNSDGFSKKVGSFGTILYSESIDSLANWSLPNKY